MPLAAISAPGLSLEGQGDVYVIKLEGDPGVKLSARIEIVQSVVALVQAAMAGREAEADRMTTWADGACRLQAPGR